MEPSEDPHVNVLLYGPPKTGKTIGAASTPGPTLYLNGDRPNATRMAHKMFPGDLKEVRVDGLGTLIAAAHVVLKGEFTSVVLDPVGEVYTALLNEASGGALSPKIQHYGDTGTHLERFCRCMCEAPVNFVIVAHEHGVKDESLGVIEKLPWTGTNNPALAEKLLAAVDVIGYTGVVPGEGDAPARYMATLVNAEGRRGGDRFGVLGAVREVNVSEWLELAKHATAPKSGAEQE